MKVSVTTIPLAELDVDLLLVLWPADSDDVPLSGMSLSDAFGRAADDFSGKADEVVTAYPERLRARRAALVGLGEPARADAERYRRAAAKGADLAHARKVSTAALVLPPDAFDLEAAAQAAVEGFMLAAYRFSRYRTGEEAPYAGPERLVLQIDGDEKAARAGAERGRVVAECVYTARDLVNLSPDEKTPTLLARACERVAKKHGFEASVWDKALIQEEKMGGLLAVNRGSTEPPTFTILEWQPENAVNERPLVLVGKGITFDTGGLSLKPAQAMEAMKSDMAGAAAVVGTMEAVARLKLPVYLIGLIPSTDNRPGENAYVPGEVVRMHSGKTVEVLNTDAEGRLILADALSYAKTYKPELVVDLATLTGAQVVALGSEAAAVMTNETEGAAERLEAFEAAGARSGDRVHRLPMYAEYGELIKSDVADIKNVGGREAGSITAAKFLEHFVDYPWVHLDIAGPSFLPSSPKPYRPKGATGFGVRLLVEFLREYASPKRARSKHDRARA